MDDIRKYELDRALQHLCNAINNTDRQLLEELPTDGDPEQVRLRVNARRRALTTLHFVLTSEINSLSSIWELVMQSALAVEDEQVRRALINEYQTHWAANGGVEAENTIHELILLVEAALHLLPQENNAAIEMTPVRPRTYTGSRSNPALTQRVASTSGESLPQGRERHPESDNTSEELVQASTDLNKSAVAPISPPRPTLLPHSLHEQLVRLPKFDLPVFTGAIATFGEFWDVFDSAVHSNRLIPPTVKFHYLRSSLRDDALTLVAGYSITDTNYELAINTLRETYFRPTFMRMQMSRKLEQFLPASSSAISQRITLAQIKSIWLQLRKLGEQESNVFVMRIIRDKFPSRTLEHVGHQEAQDATTWGVSQLLDALDSSIKTFEAIEDTAQRRDTQLQTLALRSTSRSPSRESSPNTSRRRQVSRSPSRTRRSESRRRARCAFCCSPQHYTQQCDVAMNVHARRRIAQDYRLCYRCLSSSHTVSQCGRPPCSICQGGHHRLLCWKATKYLYRAPHSRSPSRSSRSPSTERDRSRRENLPSERGRSLRRYRSPSPRRMEYAREGTRARSVRFRNNPSQNYVETDPFAPLYVGDIIDSEDEDPMVNTIAQCSARRRLRLLPEDPRLMVVTARTRNRNTSQDELIVLLLDSGAQYSFIKEDTAKRLGLQLEDPQCLTTKSFGGHTTTEVSSVVRIVLWDTMNAEMQFIVRTRRITTSIRKDTYISDRDVELLRSSNNQSLFDTEVDIDLLIGIDYYWKIVDPFKAQTLPSGHTLVYTRFGPVMSGTDASSSTNALSVGMATETGDRGDDSEPDIRQLWDLEFLGIIDSANPRQDDKVNEEVVKQYYETVQVIDGIVYVQFPWKQQHPRLFDNKVIALKRLEYQYDKLHDQPDLWREYCITFENQERSGIIEEVAEYDFDGPRVYYMPHQAVLKADSSTTAVRIVFDASSHAKDAPSLNDCLHQGPTLLPDLAGALLRARMPRFLIISDVEKAFHQIRLQKDQRDATRFLWLRNTSCPPTQDNLRIFRFTRVVFGINVSPFLLNMSIKYALERDNSNTLREEVLANTYVDNVLIGAKDTEECIKKQQECKQIFHRMGMNLREFMSNNTSVMEHIPEHDRMKNTTNTVKLLGLQWDPTHDTLHVCVNLKSFPVNSKRTALQALASNFDPLGYLTPLFVQAKIFIQDLWRDEYEWDAPLDETYSARWQEIVDQVEGYRCSIPRFITRIDDQADHELLVFADASQRMYSTVAYMLSRAPNTSVQSHLLMAKTRLAPLKQVSIPRLELMACDTAVSLAQFLLKELRMTIKIVRFFSDSRIALFWIQSDRPVKTFVDNRVKRIRGVIRDLALVNVESKFYYVSSKDNPADCMTRGLTAREISNHIWWNGPSYVRQCPTTWPHLTMDFHLLPTSNPDIDSEFKVNTISLKEEHRSVLPFQRIHNYYILVRCTARVLKFLRKRVYDRVPVASRGYLDQLLHLERVSVQPLIGVADVGAAEILLFREHQRESLSQSDPRLPKYATTYTDRDGIMRVSTRIHNVDLVRNSLDLIILAPYHPLTTMIITRCHQNLFHTGVEHVVSTLRQRYFIPKLRRVVRSIVSRCVTCKRLQGRPYKYPNSPDLPLERVTQSRPFQRIGLDYFGPLTALFSTVDARKVWVCLFTCMTTRALHLELVHNNSSMEFLLAFRRFMARRGTPDYVVSDNAPTFRLGKDVLANELLQFAHDSAVHDFTTQNALRWQFITPFSPWKGGFYERLIGMVKRSLKKTLHRNTLEIRNFETLLIEIEAYLNTRPLTTANMEATGKVRVLRPVDLINPQYHLRHFLPPCRPRSEDLQYYNPSDSDVKQHLQAQHESLTSTLNRFWSLWRSEYLQGLAERSRSNLQRARGTRSWPKVGEVVIIVKDNVPRTTWPLAIVTRLNTSKDGALRSVQLKTGKDSYTDRSVNQLIPLELHAHSFEDGTEGYQRNAIRPKSLSPTRIQPARSVKRSRSR